MRQPVSRETTVTVKVPVHMSRDAYRGAGWDAEARTGSSGIGSWFRVASEPTEARAKEALAALILASLARADERPIIVQGGAPDYANSMHLIVPAVRGYDVHVIRDGRTAATWQGSHGTLEEALAGVLRHVGGTPNVIRL